MALLRSYCLKGQVSLGTKFVKIRENSCKPFRSKTGPVEIFKSLSRLLLRFVLLPLNQPQKLFEPFFEILWIFERFIVAAG
jgi:hypothetical protein